MIRFMQTTVRLDPKLLAEAKNHAAESGGTLTSFIEKALRESLARRRPHVDSKPVRLKTVKGNGVRPGVDLDDNVSVRSLMGS